ncbi:MAG: PilZ domain-containing protein, partial [Deltaproteobacteria bacterium]|nr:PilZ domain-containing protein [Deltaproteobacteria bacterium]
MRNMDNGESERRKYNRITYPEEICPKITIKNIKFKVADISEEGLGFLNNQKMTFKGWVSGTLSFQNGRNVDVEAIVVRQADNNLGLHFVSSLPKSLIKHEREFVDSNIDNGNRE